MGVPPFFFDGALAKSSRTAIHRREMLKKANEVEHCDKKCCHQFDHG